MNDSVPQLFNRSRGRYFRVPFHDLKHHSAFWWWFVAVLVVSSALAYLGARLGSDLATMGQLLGGTLGVAVAFAGAYAAYKIASFANRTLSLQELREANRTANETLEKSIGQILTVQFQFEALLRFLLEFGQEKRKPLDPKPPAISRALTECGAPSQALINIKEGLLAAAKALSKGVENVLTNPLAISVLFALQTARTRGRDALHQKRPGASQRMLVDDLSQIPRLLDAVVLNVEQQAAMPETGRDNPLIQVIRLLQSLGDKFLDDPQLSTEYLAVCQLQFHYKEDIEALAFLENLTSAHQSLEIEPLREQHLLRCMRYFIYSEQQGHAALNALFSTDIYTDHEARERIVKSDSAMAFCKSGETNEEFASVFLRKSARVYGLVHLLNGTEDGSDRGSLAAKKLRVLFLEALLKRYKIILSSDYVADLADAAENLTLLQLHLAVALRLNHLGQIKGANYWQTSDCRRHLRQHLERVSLSASLYAQVTGTAQASRSILDASLQALDGNALADFRELIPEVCKESNRATEGPIASGIEQQVIDLLNERIIRKHIDDDNVGRSIAAEARRAFLLPRELKLACINFRNSRQGAFPDTNLPDEFRRSMALVYRQPLLADEIAMYAQFLGMELQRLENGEVLAIDRSDAKFEVRGRIDARRIANFAPEKKQIRFTFASPRLREDADTQKARNLERGFYELTGCYGQIDRCALNQGFFTGVWDFSTKPADEVLLDAFGLARDCIERLLESGQFDSGAKAEESEVASL